jgi:hypothetical protein
LINVHTYIYPIVPPYLSTSLTPHTPQTHLLSLLTLLSPQLHEQENQSIPTNHKQHHNPRIPPSIILLPQIQCRQIISSSSVLTNLTSTGSLRVEKVRPGTHTLHVGSKVLGTSLRRGRVEDGEFRGFAGDGDVPGCEDEEGADEIVEGVEVVKPAHIELATVSHTHESREVVNLPVSPKFRNLPIRHHGTTESHQCEKYQRIDQCSSHSIRRVCGNKLSNASIDELIHKHDEEHTAGRGSSSREANSVVETEEKLYRTHHQVRKLGYDERGHKGNPRVHFGLFLACVVDVAFLDEEGLELCCEVSSD